MAVHITGSSGSPVAATNSLPAPSGDATGVQDTINLRTAVASARTLAISAGRPVELTGRADWVYTLAADTTTRTFPSVGATNYHVGLLVPSLVKLDGKGATIRPATGQDFVLLANANATNTDIGFTGWQVDGRNQTLTNWPLVWFEGVTRLDWEDLDFNNIVRSGFAMLDCFDVVGEKSVRGDTCAGAPVGYGTPGHPVTRASLGPQLFKNVTPWTPNIFNFPGNPWGCNFVNSTVASVECTDATAGIKIFNSDDLKIPGGVRAIRCGKTDVSLTCSINGSTTVTTSSSALLANGYTVKGPGIPFGTQVSSGGAPTGGVSSTTLTLSAAATASGSVTLEFTSGNSGIKLQGQSGQTLRRVRLGPCIAVDCDGAGLFDEGAGTLDTNGGDNYVASYIGIGNTKTANYPDIWIGSKGTRIGAAVSIDSGRYGLNIRSNADDWWIGHLTIRNPGLTQGPNPCATFTGNPGLGSIDTLVTDGGTVGIQTFSATARFRVRQFRITNPTITAIALTGIPVVRVQNVGISGTATEGELVPTTDPTSPSTSLTVAPLSPRQPNRRWTGLDFADSPIATSYDPTNIASTPLAALTPGVLYWVGGLVIPPGRTIRQITCAIATVPVGQTNFWFCLLDSHSREVRTTTTDATTTAPGLGVYSRIITNPYENQMTEAPTYVGIVFAGTTGPQLFGYLDNATFGAIFPRKLSGTSHTGLTTTASLPDPATAPTADARRFYMEIS